MGLGGSLYYSYSPLMVGEMEDMVDSEAELALQFMKVMYLTMI